MPRMAPAWESRPPRCPPPPQVRFLVMGNVLPSDRRLHRKYDLKGSTWNRSVGPERRAADPHATLKDLDLDLRVGGDAPG